MIHRAALFDRAAVNAGIQFATLFPGVLQNFIHSVVRGLDIMADS